MDLIAGRATTGLIDMIWAPFCMLTVFSPPQEANAAFNLLYHYVDLYDRGEITRAALIAHNKVWRKVLRKCRFVVTRFGGPRKPKSTEDFLGLIFSDVRKQRIAVEGFLDSYRFVVCSPSFRLRCGCV